MLSSFSLTLPDMADRLRQKGRHFIDTPFGINNPNLLLGKSNADNIHHYWHKDSVKNVFDGLQANKSSEIAYRSDRFKPVAGRNATNTPFFSSNSPSNVVSARGSGNITQSSTATDKEMDDWRKFVINQRAEGYNAIRNSQPMPQSIPPKMQGIMADPNKALENQLNLLLTSIEERVYGGVIDNNLFKSLVEYVSGIQNIISSYDDAQEITDIITRFSNLNTAIEGIASRRGTIGSNSKESNLADSSIALVNRLIRFLQENISGVGRNESVRQLLQRGSREFLTQVGNPSKTPITGQLTKKEILERLDSGEWSIAKFLTADIETLKDIGRNVGYVNEKNYTIEKRQKNTFLKNIADKLRNVYGIDIGEDGDE